MAARAKKTSGARSKAKKPRPGTKARSRKTTRSERSAAARSSAPGTAASKRSSGKATAATRGTSATRRLPVSTKASGTKKSAKAGRRGDSPISRVTRVAKEIAHQATSAVAEGVEAIKEAGGSLVDRVTA